MIVGRSHGLHRGAATYPNSFKSLLQNPLHHGKHPAALHRLLTAPSTAFPGLSLPASILPVPCLLAEGSQGAEQALLAKFLTPSPPRCLFSASPTDVAAQHIQRAGQEQMSLLGVPPLLSPPPPSPRAGQAPLETPALVLSIQHTMRQHP